MGGKSRKTGGVSRSLIDRIKKGGTLGTPKADTGKKPSTPRRDPFGLGNKPTGK